MVKPNVFDIRGRIPGSKVVDENKNNVHLKDYAFKQGEGFITFEDIFKNGLKFTDKELDGKQKLQVLLELEQTEAPHICVSKIEDFLRRIKYPVYHLDFESLTQPIPEWDGISPTTKIPFQYSLHIQEKDKRKKLKHKEFLCEEGKEGEDPRRDLAEELCKDIPEDSCVTAYYMPFEKKRLEELAEYIKKDDPKRAKHLLNIRDNIIDLMEPFQTGAYYCREMNGSHSIKQVLPALFPNDPDLDYKSLTINGATAGREYAKLPEVIKKDKDQYEKTRTDLLAYCELDTYAMVKLLSKLKEAVKDNSKCTAKCWWVRKAYESIRL